MVQDSFPLLFFLALLSGLIEGRADMLVHFRMVATLQKPTFMKREPKLAGTYNSGGVDDDADAVGAFMEELEYAEDDYSDDNVATREALRRGSSFVDYDPGAAKRDKMREAKNSPIAQAVAEGCAPCAVLRSRPL